jgi:hypothetical protein
MWFDDGRVSAANSVSIVASIVSVLANLPMARAKSRTCLWFTTAMGNVASAQSSSSGCSRPPVLSQMMSVGLFFLAYFTNFCFQHRPSLQSELEVLAARVARQVLSYEQEAVRTLLETRSARRSRSRSIWWIKVRSIFEKPRPYISFTL